MTMTARVHTINIQKEVNPHFKPVWTSKKPYNILKGGRNSFKSSVIALKLVYMMVKMISRGETANVVIIRKVANTIRDSVFNKIQWALNKFGILSEFKMTVAPFRITHKGTGSTFYFYGQDDFEKLKSMTSGTSSPFGMKRRRNSMMRKNSTRQTLLSCVKNIR